MATRRRIQAVEVLLATPSAGDAKLTRQALYGYPVPVHVHIARDGEQALLMLTNPVVQLDLIILDLNVPKISGLALLERLTIGATPVVVFSSTASPEEEERSLALGIREFVPKPKNLEEFSETIRRVVERWAMPAGR